MYVIEKMSDRKVIFNDNHISEIMINKGLSYYLTPKFDGIKIEELKTKFYEKILMCCQFITQNSPEIRLFENGNMKIEKRRVTWANVITKGSEKIVLIYISNKTPGGSFAGSYTLYSTHNSYNKNDDIEMVKLPGSTDQTNINRLVSNTVIFDTLEIINDTVLTPPPPPPRTNNSSSASGGGELYDEDNDGRPGWARGRGGKKKRTKRHRKNRRNTKRRRHR